MRGAKNLCHFVRQLNVLECFEYARCKIICVTVSQVDVLESQFSQLLHQINSTRDFESIRLAHDHFLSNLLAQSFILLKPVSINYWLVSSGCFKPDFPLGTLSCQDLELSLSNCSVSIFIHFKKLIKQKRKC